MPAYVKVSGAWKQATTAPACYVKVNGAWKKCSQVYIKVNGAWKPCYETYSTGTKTISNWTCPLSKITLTDVKPNTVLYISGTFRWNPTGNATSMVPTGNGLKFSLTGCQVNTASVNPWQESYKLNTYPVGVNSGATVSSYSFWIDAHKTYNFDWKYIHGDFGRPTYGAYVDDLITTSSTVTISSNSWWKSWCPYLDVHITIKYTYEKYS